MNTKELAFLARVAQDNGLIEQERYFDRLWRRFWNIDWFMDYMKIENEWMKNNQESKKKEIQLIEETDEEWKRERRLEFLERELPRIYARIDEWEKSKQRAGEWWMFERELQKERGKYRNYYVEYGTLRNGDDGNGEMFSEEVIQRCREVPLETLIDGKIVNIGNGKKKVRCPFHEEKEPSFVIYADNSFFCFGCNVAGSNAITYVMRKQGLNFKKTIEYLMNF